MSIAISIRPSEENDRVAIAMVHGSVFGEQGSEIAQLVNDIHDDVTAKPNVSLVAESDHEIVGHVLFTTVSIEPATADSTAMILAPIGVAESNQKQGVGSRLIRCGLQQLKLQGVKLVFVLGYPDYYQRFGFQPAGARGLQAPHPIPDEHADAWMVIELTQGAIAHNAGTVRCSQVLGQPQYWRS